MNTSKKLMLLVMTTTLLFVFAMTAMLSSPVKADDGRSNGGRPYSKSVTCLGVDAALNINIDGSQPVMYVGEYEMEFERGPNYAGPFCLKIKGRPAIGYTQVKERLKHYYVINPDGGVETEVSKKGAAKLGF